MCPKQFIIYSFTSIFGQKTLSSTNFQISSYTLTMCRYLYLRISTILLTIKHSAFFLYCERKLTIKSKMLSKLFLKTCFGNETEKNLVEVVYQQMNFNICIFTVCKNQNKNQAPPSPQMCDFILERYATDLTLSFKFCYYLPLWLFQFSYLPSCSTYPYLLFFLRKLFQRIRLYIKGMFNGQPATHRLANT